MSVKSKRSIRNLGENLAELGCLLLLIATPIVSGVLISILEPDDHPIGQPGFPTTTPIPVNIQPAPTFPPTKSPVPKVIVNENANLRAGPGTEYPIVGGVPKGTSLQLNGITPDLTWCRLVTGEWIAAFLIDNRPELPIVSGILRPPAPTPTPACIIKGNVSFETGERIYHLPNCPDYPKTVINPRYGERWFCTEAEAIANGWRKAKNCP